MSSCQDQKYKSHLDTVALEHTKNYTYLGLNISGTGNVHKDLKELRDKARRAFYAIKRNIKFDKPIRMLFGSKQRVHSGRIPDHCDWHKIKESFDYVQTQWAQSCYWERPP